MVINLVRIRPQCIDERSVRLGEVAWHSLLQNVSDKAERFITTKQRKGAKKYQCLATMMGKVEKIIEQSEAYEDTDLTLDEWLELIKNSVKESGTTIGKVPIKKELSKNKHTQTSSWISEITTG